MKTEKLGHLCDISIGRTPSRSESSYWGKGYKWVSISDLKTKVITLTKEEITEEAISKVKCRLIPKGTLLYSFKLSIGKMSFAGEDLYTNEAIAALVVKDSNKLFNPYLYYAMKVAVISGSNQAVMGITLNSKSLDEIQIPLPPLQDQIRIAHLLEKVEGLIAKRKEDLAQLDIFLKSVFLEMFGDPVRNEKGWEKKKISSAASLQGGYAFKSADILEEGNVKLVKISNVHVEKLQWSEIAYLPEEFLDKHSDYSLNPGDLLIALTRPIIKSLNAVKTATVRSIDLPCMVNQRVGRFKLNSSKVNTSFLREFCSTQYFKNEVDKLCSEALQPNVSTSQIEAIVAFFPPLALQNKFAAIVERVESLKCQYQQSLTDLESLYGTLSQKAFAGELDLEKVKV